MFRKKGAKNAIVEAVAGLILTRPMNQHEVEALAKQHDGAIKDALPRVSRSQAFNLFVGEAPPPPGMVPSFGGGIVFDRVQPDGTLAWRLRAEDAQIAAHCLDYSRWDKGDDPVGQKAKEYLSFATGVVKTSNDLAVKGFVYQTIDVFEWSGDPEAYDAATLFKRDSKFIPSSIWGRGPLWHLHQGWFRTDNLPESGKSLLERIHIDSVRDNRQVLTVKIDMVHLLELNEPVAFSTLFEGSKVADVMFDKLHALNKSCLGDYITSEVAKEIQLNV